MLGRISPIFNSLYSRNTVAVSQINCIHKRSTHTGLTYLNADEAVEIVDSKVGSIEVSLWISRVNSREKNFHIRPERRIPEKLRHQPYSYLAVASPLRKVKNCQNYYQNLLQRLQPDIILMAVEDEFRPYITSPDPFNLAGYNASIFRAPTNIIKRGFFDGEYDRLYHKVLRSQPFYRNSDPYENYRWILSHANDILGCKTYTGGRFGFNEIGMQIPEFPRNVKLKLAWIGFNQLLNAFFLDFVKHRYGMDHSLFAIENHPFYALNHMAKCFNLMAAVDHLKVEMREKIKKTKLSVDSSLQNLPDEPLVLVVASPRTCDLLLRKNDFHERAAPDIDREDLDLYELPDNALENPNLIKSPFLKQLKYKSSLIAPLLF